ncbi:uncharacterized protein BDFB_008354 [Asbolus verrucosus]|uniref:Uncharacterized protein n=1 Tax=Asbolus verrucosus TaxID=1661398 RepID=A0A482VJ09_ASBVE|nr:uncharacterized protein BDFB_008354 [Asbolus verrucosus]
MFAVPNQRQNHKEPIPSQIFVEPQGERIVKRMPPDVIVEPEGEKGELEIEDVQNPKVKRQATDFESAVHKTFKSHRQNEKYNNMKNNKQGDFYYVDLEDNARRNQDKYDERRYGWLSSQQNYYHPHGGNRYMNRPILERARQEHFDYPVYESEPHHQNVNDEVAFERALSYEIEPKFQELNYNNPAGNSLYSVDEGRPDNVEPFYPERGYPPARLQNDYPQAMTNERFFIDADNKVKKIENTATSTTSAASVGSATTADTNTSTTTENNQMKTIKQVGNGFIEISKTRRDDETELQNYDEKSSLKKTPLQTRIRQEEYGDSLGANDVSSDVDKQSVIEMKDAVDGRNQESSILSKNSLHPLRVRGAADGDEDEEERFQSRKLQFVDDEMINIDSHEEYEDLPNRARRDFLDALGMKNEEDYSEDNPYRDALTVNNTDIHNDTTYQNFTTPSHKCLVTTTKSTNCPQKEDVKSIKQILEEPKEMTGQNTVGNFKNAKEKKRAKKRFSKIEDFDDVIENYEIRNARDTSEVDEANDMEAKILQNKNKVYNYREDVRNRNFNDNQVQVRQGRVISTWSEEPDTKINNDVKKSISNFDHRINKKQDMETMDEATTSPFPPVSNCTESGNVNSTYEQVAHQMDIENEKLAQVVNGHLATKIVSSVFDELKKKSSLRTKFYSGLSRKHVDFAGTIDFDIFKTNETEDVDEARLLLEQITKVLNKLVLNQVRRKLCQRLPDELHEYLDTILNVKNVLENVNFVPNPNQGDFLFTYHEQIEPPFSVKKLQETLVQLEGLLLSYNNLSEDCQNRAEPVKDYIERHVKMLKQMVNCPTHNCASESKRNTPNYNSRLIEKQLESVGLGKNHEFIPNFDINQLIKNKMKFMPTKKEQKRNAQKNEVYKSQKYKKLELAAERVREKRENENKIAELFGSKKKRSPETFDVDYEEPVVYSLD